jgi:microcystin-dependent protein
MDVYIGTIMIFAGNFNPRGWAFCNGQLISIAQNTALFSLLGTYYGGNGQTTFGIPDLRGRMLVGMGQGPGLDEVVIGEQSGTNSVTLLTSNLPSHTHTATVAAGAGTTALTLYAVSETGNTVAPSGKNLAASRSIAVADYNSTGTTVALNAGSVSNITFGKPAVTIASAGSDTPIDIRQPYLGITHVICTQGIFPARN